MEIRETLLNRSSVSRYSDQAVDAESLQHILQLAGNVTGTAPGQVIRFLIIEDPVAQQALKQACEQERAKVLFETVDGGQNELDDPMEQREFDAFQEAPCVIGVLGKTGKPAWHGLAWRAVERLRLAALSEGLQVELVPLDSLEFLQPLLHFPRKYSAVALLSLGRAQQLQKPAADALDARSLCLNYRPDRDRLRFCDDPSVSEMYQHSQHPLCAFPADKQVLIDVIRTSAAINACESIDSIFECVLNEMDRFIRFDRCSIAFLDRRDNTVRLRNVRNPKGPTDGENALIPLDEKNVIGWVMLNRSGLLRNDIATENHFDEQMQKAELRSDMIVPMAVGADVYGTLNVGSRQPNAFRTVEFEVLREFGRLAGAAIYRLLEYSEHDEGATTHRP